MNELQKDRFKEKTEEDILYLNIKKNNKYILTLRM